MKTILLISPYWKEDHRWMVSSVKLAELWQRLGYKVIVACMGSGSGVEEVSPTLTIHRRKDLFIPDPWNYGIALGFAGYVRRLVAKEKPDLIIVNKLLFWTSLAALRLKLAGIPFLVLTDALVGMTWWPRGRLPKIAAAIYAWTFGWWILLCAQRVVTFHPQPPDLLKRLRIEKKTQVIPTGIDPTGFGQRTADSGQNSHPKSQVSSLKSFVLTYVGRLESVKGVDDFLAAAIAVKKKHPDIVIQVAGWHRANHPLIPQYQNRVRFLGLIDDIPALLAETDIFVLPSYSEGLSNALMEAMASRCACVASDVGGNRFLIQNGVSGFLFPPGDREALAAHLERLIDDTAKRTSLGEAARKKIEEQFSWKVVSEQYKKLFQELTE